MCPISIFRTPQMNKQSNFRHKHNSTINQYWNCVSNIKNMFFKNYMYLS